MKFKDIVQAVGQKVGDKMEYLKRLQEKLKQDHPDREKIKAKVNALIDELYGEPEKDKQI